MRGNNGAGDGPAVHELPGFLPAFREARRKAPHISTSVWREVAAVRHTAFRRKRCEAWFLVELAERFRAYAALRGQA